MQLAGDLSSKQLRITLEDKLKQLLEKTNSQLLTGLQKAWLFNTFVIPKISWQLIIMIHPKYYISKLQRLCSRYIKAWLSLPKCANPTILHTGKHEHGLKIKNLQIEYKKLQAIKSIMQKYSKDPSIRDVRKRQLCKELRSTDIHHFADICEQTVRTELQNHKRSGLGINKRPQISTIRHEVGKEVERLELESLMQSCKGKVVQGKWLNWSSVVRTDIGWQSLINNTNDKLIKFHINSTLETLPTRDNLRRWGNKILGSCKSCGLPETIKHILCTCSIFRIQGRYKWRHNMILRSICNSITAWYLEVEPKLHNKNKNSFIPFVGYNSSKSKNRNIIINGILNTAGWKLIADLKESSTSIQSWISDFAPSFSSNLVPDIILYNAHNKQVVIAELTSPWEDNIQTADNRKRSKYTPLASYLQEMGFQTFLFTFSVGARGYIGSSFDTFLRKLGLPGSRVKSSNRKAAAVSNYCSYIIYLPKISI